MGESEAEKEKHIELRHILHPSRNIRNEKVGLTESETKKEKYILSLTDIKVSR